MKFSEVLNIPKSIHMYVFNYKKFFLKLIKWVGITFTNEIPNKINLIV